MHVDERMCEDAHLDRDVWEWSEVDIRVSLTLDRVLDSE